MKEKLKVEPVKSEKLEPETVPERIYQNDPDYIPPFEEPVIER